MKKVLLIILSALLFLTSCSISESLYDHVPSMDTGNGVDSAGRFVTVKPSEAVFYYNKNGTKNEVVFNCEIMSTIHDTRDSVSGVHFYNAQIINPIPDKITVYYTDVRGSFKEDDYVFVDEYDAHSGNYNAEYGFVNTLRTQNGYSYKIVAEWSKKYYREKGYYGTAVYYIDFDE